MEIFQKTFIKQLQLPVLQSETASGITVKIKKCFQEAFCKIWMNFKRLRL